MAAEEATKAWFMSRRFMLLYLSQNSMFSFNDSMCAKRGPYFCTRTTTESTFKATSFC